MVVIATVLDDCASGVVLSADFHLTIRLPVSGDADTKLRQLFDVPASLPENEPVTWLATLPAVTLQPDSVPLTTICVGKLSVRFSAGLMPAVPVTVLQVMVEPLTSILAAPALAAGTNEAKASAAAPPNKAILRIKVL